MDATGAHVNRYLDMSNVRQCGHMSYIIGYFGTSYFGITERSRGSRLPYQEYTSHSAGRHKLSTFLKPQQLDLYWRLGPVIGEPCLESTGEPPLPVEGEPIQITPFNLLQHMMFHDEPRRQQMWILGSLKSRTLRKS